MEIGYLLGVNNHFLTTTTFGTTNVGKQKRGILSAVPLGDSVGDGTGEIAVKVLLVGSSAGLDPVLVSGSSSEGIALNITNYLLEVGGRNVTRSTYIGSTFANTAAAFIFDKDTGGLLVESTKGPATTAITNVAAANVSTSILVANGARRGGTIKNNASTIMHVCFGATGSVANSAYDLPAYAGTLGATVEIPFGYAGAISAFWEGAPTGNANVTEITQ